MKLVFLNQWVPINIDHKYTIKDYFDDVITKDVIEYIKYNKVLVEPDKRQESKRLILEFFKQIEIQESKMNGFMVMDSLEDKSELIVLSFWETKEDMDKFYQADNNLISDLVDKLKPYFKALPERRSYKVSDFKF